MSSKIRDKSGKWLDTSVFREEAIRFQNTGAFCNAPTGTPDWITYWEEQLRRCKEGYSVFDSDGTEHKITGHHYFYLNFTQIQIVLEDEEDEDSINADKENKSPDFWDGDYNYFWALEIARNGLFTKSSQVPCFEGEREIYRTCQKEIKNLKKKLGATEYKTSNEYIKLKKKRDKVSQAVLDRLNLFVKPHLDHVEGGYHMIVGKSRRKGYQQPHSEVVMTSKGPSTMGEIKVGDIVLTPKGSSKVLEKFSQGLSDVYEITLQDDRKVKCGLEHLWKIIEFRGKEKIVDTKFFLDKKLKRGSKGKEYYSYYLPQNVEVEYNREDNLPIDPYLLGLLIGDGSMTQGSVLFSTADAELLQNIKNILGDNYEIKHKDSFSYVIKHLKDNTNPLYRNLKVMGLTCRAENKFIPDVYKYSSIEDRYELVKGLMDSDGSIWKNGSCSFINTSEQVIDDLAFILRSLGIRVKKTKCNNIGKGFSRLQAWCLVITTDKQIFKLNRKATKIRSRNYNINKIAITNVEKLDYKEESSCILIEDPEHLYLTRDFIVTHNSYKDGAICANIYNTNRNAQIIIGAFEKKFLYPKGTMGMTSDYLNFINENTGWAKSRDYVDKIDHKRASYKTMENGIPVEKGYKSEIFALTFKDNPDAARGKDGKIVLLEEAGAFPNLKEAYNAIFPALTAGAYITGQIVVFGTGGDMESGTVDYADMFYNPLAYKLMPFTNIWDEGAENTLCGFFHPVTWNMEGFYDAQGNSDIEGATEFEMERRAEKLASASSSTTLQQHVQEFPFCPAEAFLTVSTNNFPVLELRNQLNKVKTEGLQFKKGTPVFLSRKDGKIEAKPDLRKELQPVYEYRPKIKDLSGCPIIYEYPIDNPPKGLYKMGYDPYRQDLSAGVSLGAIYVYKSTYSDSHMSNVIVAEYVGRPQEADDVNRIALMLADLYNAEVMHENEVTHVKNYFRRMKRLDRLAVQPDAVISKNVKSSTVARTYGCHMNDQLKDAVEKYIKDWLLTVRDYDENGDAILNLETIYSIGLLEELIQYNRKDNFDRVMAFGMVMFQIQEEVLGKDYSKDKGNAKIKEVISVLDNYYKNKKLENYVTRSPF